MKQQPAKINYFFKGAYIELFNTIRSSFRKLGSNLSGAGSDVAFYFGDFWDSFWSTVFGIVGWNLDWDDLSDAVVNGCLFSFSLGKLLCVLIFTTGLTVILSLLHVLLLIPIMVLAYLGFFLLYMIDVIYRHWKKISSNCSNPMCQGHFALPEYICPACGEIHTSLKPSRYGIWKRTCQCGEKLPTTFFNGRENLKCHCPTCHYPVKDGGKHIDICIPIVGGTNAGKTCFVNAAISEIERSGAGSRLEFAYTPSGSDDYRNTIAEMKRGMLPEKTKNFRLKYYQFYLTPRKKRVKNLISLCDVAGEVYSDSKSLGAQIGYRYANAFIMVVDPLSVEKYRKELEKIMDLSRYRYSGDSINVVLNMLTGTLENMYHISSKKMIHTDVAIVFTKCDIPDLNTKIGEPAVRAYREAHPDADQHTAQNEVCKQFLMDYDEGNVVSSLQSKFKTVRFFTCSSLGHVANGRPFVSSGVAEPVTWLLSRQVPSLRGLQSMMKP